MTVPGSYCTLHWTRRVAQKQVLFFFKLRDKCERKTMWLDGREAGGGAGTSWEHLEDSEETNETFLNEMSDIHHNPEDGCRVLQVNI